MKKTTIAAPEEVLDSRHQLDVVTIEKLGDHLVVQSSPSTRSPDEVWKSIHKGFELIVRQ
jgi:hypothetical protein